ncbi:MAG: hypothetical protein HEQ22_03440 [Sphingopyxis sp.]|uniref:hypothetical protein n=1 Tax=Sphingopyxis sp. TaxID=1908224 RepID=UPI003D80B09D
MLGQPEIFDWPASLVPTDILIQPPSKTVGMTTSVNESVQVVPSIRPPFRMTLEFETLFGPQVLAWRALIGSLEGRANRLRIPLFDLWFAAKDRQLALGLVPHSDGTGFSDGTLYASNDIEGVKVTAVQGQRNIDADFSGYGAGPLDALLQAGLYFGLHDQPYLAQRVFWNGSIATIRTNPTMRHDYAEQPLKLRPVMIAGLVNDEGGDLKLTRGRWGGPSLELVERFDGPVP